MPPVLPASAVVWITGLPAAGKTTLAGAVRDALEREGRGVAVLDGDELRASLSRDLGFDREARRENARRAGALAVERAVGGRVVVVALVSPFRADREEARRAVEAAGARFVEVFVDTPPDECRRRDPKGLYAAAAAGRLTGLTGWDDPYERPPAPDVHVGGPGTSVARACGLVLDRLAG